MNPREVLGLRLWLVSHEMITSGSPTEQFEICVSGAYFRGIWIPECGGHVTDRHTRHSQCSTTPEELYSWLWALVLRSRVVGGVSLLWRATASCERLRRMCLGELVGLSGAESGACQSILGSAMHWRELSAS